MGRHEILKLIIYFIRKGNPWYDCYEYYSWHNFVRVHSVDFLKTAYFGLIQFRIHPYNSLRIQPLLFTPEIRDMTLGVVWATEYKHTRGVDWKKTIRTISNIKLTTNAIGLEAEAILSHLITTNYQQLTWSVCYLNVAFTTLTNSLRTQNHNFTHNDSKTQLKRLLLFK